MNFKVLFGNSGAHSNYEQVFASESKYLILKSARKLLPACFFFFFNCRISSVNNETEFWPKVNI